MKTKYRDIPGFPGDTDEDVELHHAAPIHWTKKMTIWSIGMVVVFFMAAGAIVFVAADKL